MSERPKACPTCFSPRHDVHPGSVITQKPIICPDPFHDVAAERVAMATAIRAAVAVMKQSVPGVRFAIYIEHDKAEGVVSGAANFVPLQPVLDAWACDFDKSAIDGKVGPALKAMADAWEREHRPRIVKG